MKKKSHLDENTISAYIEKKLDEKDFISAEEHISNCKECLNALNTVIEAKKLMGNEENFIELPYTLSEKVKEEIEKLTSGKIKLVLKIIKNGIEEIMNSLNGTKELITYPVRGTNSKIQSVHFTHNLVDMNFDLYAFFEDIDHIRIRLDCSHNKIFKIDGFVSLKKNDKFYMEKHTDNGEIEFDNIARGEYEIIFEEKHILSNSNNKKNKKVHIFITLN